MVIVEGEGAVLGVNLGRTIVTNGAFATRSSQITFRTCYHYRAGELTVILRRSNPPYIRLTLTIHIAHRWQSSSPLYAGVGGGDGKTRMPVTMETTSAFRRHRNVVIIYEATVAFHVQLVGVSHD